MTKNQERQKKWAVDIAAHAVSFVVCMFVGRDNPFQIMGMYDKRIASDIEEARQLRIEMEAEYEGRNGGRRALIYALTSNNQSVVVE
jgi:hypothetical protein